MKYRVNEHLGMEFNESPLRHVIYSSHDVQIANMIEWLHPNNIAMEYVVHAFQVVLELHYNKECIATFYATEACFNVTVRFNGIDLSLNACAASVKTDGTGCAYTDFKEKEKMAGIWYDGYSAVDLDVARMQPVTT